MSVNNDRLVVAHANMQNITSTLVLRWDEARCELGSILPEVQLTWDFGESKLFRAERCNASTTGDGSPQCHIRFSTRILNLPEHNVDAIIRHEIGHVIDITTFPMNLEQWAFEKGNSLPYTPERRADAIAELIWAESINYDENLVQTLEAGTSPRPEKLGR